jgi:MFS family permease
MASAVAAAGAAHAEYNPRRLFILSCLALATGALVFSLYANIMKPIGDTFGLDAALVGAAVGTWGLGLALAVGFGSALLDTLGMGRVLALACILQIVGVTVTIATRALSDLSSMPPMFWLTTGQLILGIGHGCIEATINPLAATVYSEDKTHKLNVLHAWWPGGLVIGGLLGFAMSNYLELGWQTQYAIIYVPAVAYGLMVIGQKFPPTERKAAGVSAGEMWKEAVRPLYIVWWCCMWITAALELGPGRWVAAMLSGRVGMAGILLLVYISALMFVMRHFAGTLAQRLSPVGLMWLSSVLAGIGLFALSWATNPVLALLAATVWGIGVCYMWPTMLGVTSERFPRGGALLMGLTGVAGSLSQFFVLPFMGAIYDRYTQAALGSTPLTEALTNPALKSQLGAAQLEAAPMAFRIVSLGAIVLVIAFGAIWARDRAAGGYKAERLETVELGQADPADFSTDAVLSTEEGTASA